MEQPKTEKSATDERIDALFDAVITESLRIAADLKVLMHGFPQPVTVPPKEAKP